jgi:hypothetical protein
MALACAILLGSLALLLHCSACGATDHDRLHGAKSAHGGKQAGQAARVRVGVGKPGEAGRCRMGTRWCVSTWTERGGANRYGCIAQCDLPE